MEKCLQNHKRCKENNVTLIKLIHRQNSLSCLATFGIDCNHQTVLEVIDSSSFMSVPLVNDIIELTDSAAHICKKWSAQVQ